MNQELPSDTAGPQARGQGGRLPSTPSTPHQASVLAGLNAHLDQASRRARESLGSASGAAGATTWPPLRSAQRFHETWSLISAETEVVEAEQRAPDNAGPLNSHRLVLHTLSALRALSPEYLQAFLAQAETLLWLEQAQGLPRAVAPAKGKVPVAPKGRRSRGA